MEDVNISQSLIDDYDRDGVVCVRGIIGRVLIDRLRDAVDLVLDSPMTMTQESFDPESQIRAKYRQGFNGWKVHEVYREMIFDSAVPRVAARLMQSKTLRLIYDQTLVKEPGTTVPVKWHQDLPFWPFTGDQICSVWIALDVVTKESGAVHYLRGSHKGPNLYRPPDFNDGESPGEGIANLDLPLSPNFFDEPGADLICWEMEPGDALVFNARTLHGSGANLRTDRSRRAVAPRFAGDDARFVEGMHILNLSFETQPNLKTGDPIDDPLFPAVIA